MKKVSRGRILGVAILVVVALAVAFLPKNQEPLVSGVEFVKVNTRVVEVTKITTRVVEVPRVVEVAKIVEKRVTRVVEPFPTPTYAFFANGRTPRPTGQPFAVKIVSADSAAAWPSDVYFYSFAKEKKGLFTDGVRVSPVSVGRGVWKAWLPLEARADLFAVSFREAWAQGGFTTDTTLIVGDEAEVVLPITTGK